MKLLIDNIKSNKKKVILVLLIIIILSIGFSYAYYKISLKSDGNNVAKSDCFELELTSENDAITLNNMYPISDEEGLKTTGYTFTIKNICSIYASYQVNLEDLEVAKKLSNEYVKVSINNSIPKLLSTYQTVTPAIKEAIGSYMLTGGTLAPKDMNNSSKTYTLRLWMDYDTPLSDETTNAGFKNKISVIATARTKEELANNLAISYNGTYTENKSTINVSAHSDKYNIIEYSYDNLTFNSLDNPSKDVNITVDNTNNNYENIYFKDEVGNVTEKSINNSAVTLVGSLDGEKTKVEINNIPSDKSTKEYQFSKDNINWITSDSNSYSFDDLGSENTLYGRVVYADNNVDTYSIDSTNFAVAKLNEINYSSLNAAVKKVSGKEKSTVYLLKDICENINVTEDKNISLDLQSHSVSCSDNTTALLTNNGSLEIKNGNISNNLKTIINNGSITQLSGTISSTLEDNPTVINNPSASYTLNDGVISSKKSNAFVNQGTYIMNGGTISSDIDGLIFANMGGEATFTTGNIISSSQSSTLIYNRVGTVNLNGINLSNQSNVLFNGDSNGYHEAILNINGGSFSTNGIAIDNYAVINHKGGTISSDNDTSVTVLNEENSTYNLDGGSISSEKSNAIRNNGILKMLSGNLTSAGSFPTLANDNGTSTLKGGTITNTGTEALVYNATGTVNLEGIELSNTNLVIKNGDENITTGTININSGTVSSEDKAAIRNYGIISHSGGTVSSNSTSELTVNNQATGSYTLSWGSITSSTSNAFNNLGTFEMTSGTMTTNGNSPTYVNNGGTTTLKSGTIQNAGNNPLVYNLVGTTTIDGINLANKGTTVQNGNSDNTTAILNINSGTVSSEDKAAIDNYATVNHSGGTISSNATSSVTVYNPATGSYNLSGGMIKSLTNTIKNVGTFVMTSGTLTTDGDYSTYYNNGGTATFKGGTIQNPGNSVLVNNKAGTTTIDGINLANKGITVKNGDSDNTTAILNINSGTISSEEESAIDNYATVNHSDGALSSSATSSVTVYNLATGRYTLSGGSITSSASNAFSNRGTFVMTSGTLTTDVDYSTYYNNGGTATFKGGTIQNPGNSVLINNKAGTTTIDGINLANKSVAIQNGNSDNTTAILNVKSGTISSEESLAISNYATVNHSDGTISSNATASVTVANRATGSYTLNGGMITSKTNVFNNLGTFMMTSGTMTTDGNYPTYYNNGGTATFQGGTIQNPGNKSLVYNLAGTTNIEGINLTNKGTTVQNGDSDNTTAILNINSGAISSEENLAIRNYATVNHLDGTVSSNTTSSVTVYNLATGSYTLSGGSITSSASNAFSNRGTFMMTSGTMTTNDNSPTYYNNDGTATFQGGTIQNTGNNILVYNLVGTTNIDGINLANKSVAIQNGNSDNTTAILNINSGTISSEENLAISNYATVNHSDGTVSSSATSKVTVINATAGSYTLSGGSITSNTGNAFINQGTFMMKSGTMTTGGNAPTYVNNGGTTTINDGIIIQSQKNRALIYNLAGTTNIEGINLNNKDVTVQNGASDNTTAILNINSGTISSEEEAAIINYATVNHSGGTVSSNATSKVTVYNPATGSYTLSGGSITSSASNAFSNLGTFVMTSGTMTTDGNAPTYVNNGGTATIRGGTIIQSQNNSPLVYNKVGTTNIDGMSFTHNSSALKNGNAIDDSVIMNLTNCNITSTGSTAITNYGSLTITNGSVTSSAANAINNSRKVTLKGNAKITSSIKNYPTIYNKSGATLTKDSTVTVTNMGGGTAIYNAS